MRTCTRRSCPKTERQVPILVHSPTHSLAHLTHLTRSFTHSLTRSPHSLTHSLPRSLSHLTRSLTSLLASMRTEQVFNTTTSTTVGEIMPRGIRLTCLSLLDMNCVCTLMVSNESSCCVVSTSILLLNPKTIKALSSEAQELRPSRRYQAPGPPPDLSDFMVFLGV